MVYLGDRNLEAHTLRSVVEMMSNTYCNTSVCSSCTSRRLRYKSGFKERMESTQNVCALNRDQQVRILTKLTEAELFETFIHAKYLGAKRFSLEGGEPDTAAGYRHRRGCRP